MLLRTFSYLTSTLHELVFSSFFNEPFHDYGIIEYWHSITLQFHSLFGKQSPYLYNFGEYQPSQSCDNVVSQSVCHWQTNILEANLKQICKSCPDHLLPINFFVARLLFSHTLQSSTSRILPDLTYCQT